MLAETVREAAKRFGEAPALVAPGGWSVSYAQLDRLSDGAAGGLSREGIASGDVVALLLPSSPDYVVAYAATAKLGAITVGINPRLAPPERSAAIATVAPDLVLAEHDLISDVVTPSRVIALELGEGPDDILSHLRGPRSAPAEPASAEVTIVLTSGTTGSPRGAVFGAAQLEAIAQIDTRGRWGGGSPMLVSTELVHIGFMTKLPWYLRAGAPIHLLGKWRAADALRIISRERMTSVGGIAAQFALMLRDPDFDRYDLSSVKTLVAGGGPSPPAMVREARRRFDAAYSIRYSSTESGGVGTMTAFDAEDDEVFTTVGRPRPGVELSIHDDDGANLPQGVVGEVWMRSPAIMSEYWRDPEATTDRLRDEWLRTGDLGSLDELGRLRLAGRQTEMYIRGGYNVYPMEVEAALASHPGVAQVAVVPKEDPVMGEIGVAIVVPVDRAAPPALDDLRRFAESRLARHKLPEELRLVDDLPFTSLHKLDRRRLMTEVSAPHPLAI